MSTTKLHDAAVSAVTNLVVQLNKETYEEYVDCIAETDETPCSFSEYGVDYDTISDILENMLQDVEVAVKGRQKNIVL